MLVWFYHPSVIGCIGPDSRENVMNLKPIKMLIVAAGLAALATGAQAALNPTGLDCDNEGAVASMGALDCSGAWMGNNVNQQSAVLAQLDVDFADVVGDGGIWSYLGTTNAGETSGPFSSVPGATSGSLSFDTPITGYFAVALKTASDFSLYLFDGGMSGVSSIDFTTIGASLNEIGEPQNLSHASLYQYEGGLPPVPEAETYLMMLAGLGLVAYSSRRRRA